MLALDMDFMGKPFGAMPQLLAIADFITKLHAICVTCGNMASYSFRKTGNSSQVFTRGKRRVYATLQEHYFEK
jgi:thymidine kinase